MNAQNGVGSKMECATGIAMAEKENYTPLLRLENKEN